MNRQYKHIFDESACITQRQMKDYLGGQMIKEESHALEHHVNGCPFCSQALEGVANDTLAIEQIDHLNTEFLKEHFALIEPQLHLNSMGPVRAVAHRPNHKRSLLYTSTIAVVVLMIAGLMWFMESKKLFHHVSLRTETSADESATVQTAAPLHALAIRK